MLNKIKEIKRDRRIAKQKRIKEEKERERMRIKEAKIEEERIKEELREINERKKEIENKKDNFMKEEGLDKLQFNKDVMSDYQKAKYYLKRNGYSWGHINRMKHYKLFYEANSMIAFKAKEKDIPISVSNPYEKDDDGHFYGVDAYIAQLKKDNPDFYR
ncbi:hypothetical protein CPT_MarsHill_189 [Staphylococcus phage MarsHill]|nr:hypothetical protein CPT_MarsHill_189 [Staphylococcus phage MarsHill]